MVTEIIWVRIVMTEMRTRMGTRMVTMIMWTRMEKTMRWKRMVTVMWTRRIMMITVVGLSSKKEAKFQEIML